MSLVVDVLEVNDWMRDYERIAVPVRTRTALSPCALTAKLLRA
jgi:hypothetical protein